MATARPNQRVGDVAWTKMTKVVRTHASTAISLSVILSPVLELTRKSLSNR